LPKEKLWENGLESANMELINKSENKEDAQY